MSPPISDIFAIQATDGAGRGVFATKSIPSDAITYRSDAPSARIIFWQYRKEVCSQCFFYDRGRTLPVRVNSVGKAFCSSECYEAWEVVQGAIGLEAWKNLHEFVQMKAKSISNSHSLPALTPKPDEDEIESVWKKAEETAAVLRRKRLSTTKPGTTFAKNIANAPWSHVVDPDILGYLLSGCLFRHKDPHLYETDVLELAMDSTPYRSTPDLQAHSSSFLQLTALVPSETLPSITSPTCKALICAASHNSFGIRDGDEYLGYGLYPGASYFNHSCRPNIGKKRVGAKWEFQVLREIVAGEQCCITYLGGDEDELTVLERTSRLRAFWGFNCACDRCKNEER